MTTNVSSVLASEALTLKAGVSRGSGFPIKHNASQTPSSAWVITCAAQPGQGKVELTSLNNANGSLNPG